MTLTQLLRRCSVLGTTMLTFSLANASEKTNAEWYPQQKRGLWEIVNSQSSNTGYKTTELRCVGARAQETRTAKKEYLEETKDCRTLVLETSAKKVEQRRECKKYDGVIAKVSVVYQGDFSSHFERTMTLSLNIPTRLESETKTKKYRYIGACPKGMSPGDTFTTNSDGNVVGEWNRYTGRAITMKSRPSLDKRKPSAP